MTKILVISTDPVTGEVEEIGKFDTFKDFYESEVINRLLQLGYVITMKEVIK